MIYAGCTAGVQKHHLELLTEKLIKSSMYYITYCQASVEEGIISFYSFAFRPL